MDKPTIKVEVVYALPSKQTLLALSVAEGTKVPEAIERSGILLQHPELNRADLTIGIFAKKLPQPADYVLQEGDRIELYRPLLADPKEVRRLRAKRAAIKKV